MLFIYRLYVKTGLSCGLSIKKRERNHRTLGLARLQLDSLQDFESLFCGYCAVWWEIYLDFKLKFVIKIYNSLVRQTSQAVTEKLEAGYYRK